MQHVGKVLSLYISDKETSRTLEKNSIEIDKPGIIHDKHYNKDIERSILITSVQSYELLNRYDIHIPYGTLGENLLIDFNPYHLPIGTKLQIGETLLEITQNCTLCKHLALHDKRIPKLLKNDRGIFAKAIQRGLISIDDSIYLIGK
jgi:MOSC domain-containing protein YiiM